MNEQPEYAIENVGEVVSDGDCPPRYFVIDRRPGAVDLIHSQHENLYAAIRRVDFLEAVEALRLMEEAKEQAREAKKLGM